jgi:uncharacterized protein (UPF0276 family)
VRPLPTLGVGVAWFSGLEPLLAAEPGLVDVIEVEPQTLWLQPDPTASRFRIDPDALERIGRLPGRKILHGIGFAPGGTLEPEASQLPPLLAMRAALDCPWVSEHLSFNRARGRDGVFTTGFLLPPRQSAAGAAHAARSIRAMAAALPVPLAVETGVSYLQPRADELPDGEFVARVAEEADCGILLDLHNLWCNEKNGRQPVAEFLRALPLERVWEVHLAGGFERRGYWLDSHSGAIPAPLAALAAQVLPRLPALRALVYELFPSYLQLVGLDTVRRELERLRALWRARECAGAARTLERPIAAATPVPDGPSPEAWEDALGALVVGRTPDSPLAHELAADRGVGVTRELLEEFRASMVVELLKLTFRVIALSRGPELFERALAGYWRRAAPERFGSAEAAGFAEHLAGLALDVPYLDEVLAFERAAIATLLDGRARVVPFRHDPMLLLRPLAEGRLPQDPPLGAFEVEVTPPEVPERLDPAGRTVNAARDEDAG